MNLYDDCAIIRKKEVTMEKIIEIKDLNFAYNSTNAFNDFSMEIEEGDIVTLIGTRGSGKTTLLKMLCHQLPNDTIYYNGRKISSYNVQDLQRDIVVIFDTPIVGLTPLQELKRFISKIGLSKEDVEKRLETLIAHFGLEEMINEPLNRLSRENTYLIKVLRYLIINPKFLAIDSILDCIGESYKKKFFAYIKKHEITLLNVTNNLDDALYGNKLFVLENFVLILEGNTLSVLKTDTLLKRLGFRLPLPVDLSIELNHYEVLKKIYTDNEKLVNALWK